MSEKYGLISDLKTALGVGREHLGSEGLRMGIEAQNQLDQAAGHFSDGQRDEQAGILGKLAQALRERIQ